DRAIGLGELQRRVVDRSSRTATILEEQTEVNEGLEGGPGRIEDKEVVVLALDVGAGVVPASDHRQQLAGPRVDDDSGAVAGVRILLKRRDVLLEDTFGLALELEVDGGGDGEAVLHQGL